MSRYWQWQNNLSPGETARAEEVNQQFSEINNALTLVEGEINRSFRVGAAANVGLGASDLEAAESAAQRANKVLGCDDNGKPTFVNAAFRFRGPWGSGLLFSTNDVVQVGIEQSLYVCAIGHTSSPAFSTDQATKWLLMVDLTTLRKAIRTWQIVTSSQSPFQASAGDDLMVDVSNGPVTITLPAAPALSDQGISITHVAGPIASPSNNIIVSRNGQLIMGLSENMAIDSPNAGMEFAFANPTLGWRLVRGT